VFIFGTDGYIIIISGPQTDVCNTIWELMADSLLSTLQTVLVILLHKIMEFVSEEKKVKIEQSKKKKITIFFGF
jgi:hypothetical protein